MASAERKQRDWLQRTGRGQYTTHVGDRRKSFANGRVVLRPGHDGPFRMYAAGVILVRTKLPIFFTRSRVLPQRFRLSRSRWRVWLC